MTFDREIGLTPFFTLAMWATSLTVGAVGLAAGDARPPASAPPRPPMQATLIRVQLTPQQLAEPATGNPDEAAAAPTPPAETAQPPPMPQAIAPPQSPALMQLDEPAMVVPVRHPVFAVPVAQPKPHAAPPAPAPAVTHLTYGRGEGRQPAPEYPREAALGGQQGTVTLRFTVGEDGAVMTVDIVSACPWPLLNQAAARAVRETWRFRPGEARTFEVSMRFQLKSNS